VLVDHDSELEYTPLAHLAPDQPRYQVWDSLLSEFAALGFEYGYSVIDDSGLVVWEAQFGDFVNGAQVIIDQFLTAAESKWSQRSSLVLLLPHGFEGQGPEHSSARIERFLSLCAEDNLRVIYPTTAAQYFHALRRQIHAPVRRPLVVFTPKRYLRMPSTRSTVAELTDGWFQEVLADPNPPADVRRVLLASGKVAHELLDKRDELGAPAAVLRLEQFHPWRDDLLAAALEPYRTADEVAWVQEEPENMGAASWIDRRLYQVTEGTWKLELIARPECGSPAAGSQTVHEREQDALLRAAFAGL
jgi:2-oxoglutarate dehydrogenase complex dehydrogenase (E1) component-like enzyme